MTPTYRITAGGKDVTSVLASRLVSITVTDETGDKSDQIDITLDDKVDMNGGYIQLPTKGLILSVALGYVETGLVDLGRYVIDETKLSGPDPRKITIKAKSADMNSAIKSQKTRTWKGQKLGGIVTKIASEHGLTARVSPDLGTKDIAQIDQTNESDLHFLTRIAGGYGAMVKSADGNLIVALPGDGKTTSGKSLPSRSIRLEDITSYDCTLPERGSYGSVKARWHDTANGQTRTVSYGDESDGPEYVLNKDYADEASALEAAKSKKGVQDRGTGELRLDLPGDPTLAAEMIVNVSGIRPGIDGAWRVTKAEHKLEDALLTTLTCELGNGQSKANKKGGNRFGNWEERPQ